MSSDPLPAPALCAAADDDGTSRRAAALRAGIVAALAAAALPLAHLLALPRIPLCSFRLWTGLPCPGCGMTRSMVCLFHGDALASLRFHPLGIFLGAFALGVFAGGVGGAVTGRDPFWRFVDRRSAALALAFVCALLGTWVVRTFVVPSWAPPDLSPELY